jgi:hypothetical protein
MKHFFTLLAAVLLTATTYAQVGINNENPDASAALDITSTTGGLLVPRMTAEERDAITTPSQGLIIFCSDCASGEGELQIKLTSSWKNTIGDDVNDPPPPAIGDTYGGGIVFYLDGNGGGLIAAPSDQSSAAWGCYGTVISGADGTAIGTGNQNTIDIEAGCTTSGTAADICANLTLGGYSDWFLPSKDELNEMYLNLNQQGLGGFANSNYWSSTESSNLLAWHQKFSDGAQDPINKYITINVRAVRAF